MKITHVFLVMILGLACILCPPPCEAYWCMLPDDPCSPGLPYLAEQDNYGAAACVQMALNACPDVLARNYLDQDAIFASITAHNTETTWVTGDPSGVRGALEDSIFSPCGNWLNRSNTNKSTVLGEMLCWMCSFRYLTPVSIGSSEHWVIVYGCETDANPCPSSTPVTLLKVFYYDPIDASDNMVSGIVWEGDSAHWGVPLNKPTSSWHNHYLAVIEPPAYPVVVRVPEWVLSGPVLSIAKIKDYCHRWLKEQQIPDHAGRAFAVLKEPLEIDTPILVDADTYKYYLITFKNRRVVAVFNAYSGSFEEFRQFKQPQNYILDPKTIRKNLAKTFEKYKTKNFKIQEPQFKYRSALVQTGRISPTWQAAASVTDFYGKKHELTVSLNSAGQVIKGLETLPTPPKPSPWEPHEKKRPLFSIHAGTAIPMGDFADLYKAGFNILVDFEYPLKKRFSLRTLLGYNQFKSKLIGLDDTSIVNINLNLKYSTPGKPLTFFAEAGPGYYIIKDADNKMGVNVGCGFHIKLSKRIRLEFAAHHNTIFTSDKNTYFIHLASGLIFHLR